MLYFYTEVCILVEIKNLTAVVGGKNIINDVTLSFDNLGVYAVLCASEEQKTLLAQLLSGVRDADGGEVLFDGEPMSRDNISLKKAVRLATPAAFAYGDVSPYEYIQFVGMSVGVEREKLARQTVEAIDLLGLGGVKDTPVRALSEGQKCRLSLAASLIGNPKVIVIDSALDCFGGKALEEMYGLVEMLGGIKTVVLITSKPAVAKHLCEYAALMAGGRVVLHDKIADIEAKINDSAMTKISARGESQQITDAIRALSGIRDVKLIKTSRDRIVELEIEHDYDAFIKDRLFGALAAINAPILSVTTTALTLDDVFYTLCVRAEKKNENKEAKR